MKDITGNGPGISIAQAIAQMEAEQGDPFSLEKNNLAELERRTGISGPLLSFSFVNRNP